MKIVHTFLGLILFTISFSIARHYSLAWNKDKIIPSYLEPIRHVSVADHDVDSLPIPDNILQFTESGMPLLYSKWMQVRESYLTVSKNILLMEKKYEKLAAFYELNPGEPKAQQPAFLQSWKQQQLNEQKALEAVHNKIRQHVEKYYATAALRQLDTDAAIQAEVNGLIRAADMVLRAHAVNPS